MANRLCLYVGSSTPFNVCLDISHYVWMLSDQFDIDIVATDFSDFDTGTLSYVQPYGDSHPPGRRGEYRALQEYFTVADPDAFVHVTRSNLPPWVVAAIAKSNGTRVVHRYGADEFYNYRVAEGWRTGGYFVRNNILGRLTLHICDNYMVFGPTVQRRLTARGCAPEDIVQLPPPFDPERLIVDDAGDVLPSVPDERDIVLFVGRRIRHKGFHYLVEHIPTLLELRPSLHFVFVGGGDGCPAIPTRFLDHVTLVGRVAPENIGAYFARADLLVHPTLTEAFGRVIVEAQLCGARTLARNVGDVKVATKNTFETDAEFIDSIISFETLERENGKRFSRERLKSDYVAAFEQFVNG